METAGWRRVSKSSYFCEPFMPGENVELHAL